MKQHLQHFDGSIYRYICSCPPLAHHFVVMAMLRQWTSQRWANIRPADTQGWSNMLAHRLHEYITSLAWHWPNVLGQRKAALHTLHCVPNRERMANKVFFIQPILAGKLCPPTAEYGRSCALVLRKLIIKENNQIIIISMKHVLCNRPIHINDYYSKYFV